MTSPDERESDQDRSINSFESQPLLIARAVVGVMLSGVLSLLLLAAQAPGGNPAIQVILVLATLIAAVLGVETAVSYLTPHFIHGTPLSHSLGNPTSPKSKAIQQNTEEFHERLRNVERELNKRDQHDCERKRTYAYNPDSTLAADADERQED